SVFAPRSRHSRAASSSSCLRRAASTTHAPSDANAWAAARPIPLDAPVITTTLSRRSFCFIDARLHGSPCLLLRASRVPIAARGGTALAAPERRRPRRCHGSASRRESGEDRRLPLQEVPPEGPRDVGTQDSEV